MRRVICKQGVRESLQAVAGSIRGPFAAAPGVAATSLGVTTGRAASRSKSARPNTSLSRTTNLDAYPDASSSFERSANNLSINSMSFSPEAHNSCVLSGCGV